MSHSQAVRAMRGIVTACLAFLFNGCMAPIGVQPVTTRQAYEQAQANALRTGKLSSSTVSLLRRLELDQLAARHPDEAVRHLHQKAVATGERAMLFALAELSYMAGEDIHRSLKAWDKRDARDFYLGSAVYAWLFLFGEGKEAPPSPFDYRFREACDFYNYSLGLGLTAGKGTNASVRLNDGLRRLPVGELILKLGHNDAGPDFIHSDRILLADSFRVRGLSVRNRDPGLGSPLMAVGAFEPKWQLRTTTPATVLLRVQATLSELTNSSGAALLELYSPFKEADVTIGKTTLPIESDLTTFRAFTLNQSRVWKLGKLEFLAPSEHIASQLMLNQPYDPTRIPVVLVHGTFSSPVTWAEMANSLAADPVLRQRYQFWSFIYGSGNPLVQSVADFRAALTSEVKHLDPEGTNAALNRMVIIGHSQGGLLAKSAVVNTGDRMWQVLSTNQFENLKINENDRAELRRLLFYEPLPFVRCAVFIATPHRGSYLSGSFARWLGRRFVSLPETLVSRGAEMMRLTKGSDAEKFLQGRMPTSLDGMSPDNPALLAMADIPVLSPIRAYSIIPVQGRGDIKAGRDGVVAYQSAHVDYVQSEFIVRSYHTCLNNPATIEEVRRILREQLKW